MSRPIYARVLRLRHVQPGTGLRLLFIEGTLLLAGLAALAELASWWSVPLLPLVVAALVKVEDVATGYRRAAFAATVPAAAAPSRAAQRAPGRDRSTGRHSTTATGRQSMTAADQQSMTATGRHSMTATGRQSTTATGRQSATATGRQSMTATGRQSAKATGRATVPGGAVPPGRADVPAVAVGRVSVPALAAPAAVTDPATTARTTSASPAGSPALAGPADRPAGPADRPAGPADRPAGPADRPAVPAAASRPESRTGGNAGPGEQGDRPRTRAGGPPWNQPAWNRSSVARSGQLDRQQRIPAGPDRVWARAAVPVEPPGPPDTDG